MSRTRRRSVPPLPTDRSQPGTETGSAGRFDTELLAPPAGRGPPALGCPCLVEESTGTRHGAAGAEFEAAAVPPVPRRAYRERGGVATPWWGGGRARSPTTGSRQRPRIGVNVRQTTLGQRTIGTHVASVVLRLRGADSPEPGHSCHFLSLFSENQNEQRNPCFVNYLCNAANQLI